MQGGVSFFTSKICRANINDCVEIDYSCSDTPIIKMKLLGDLLFSAVETSHQWKWERKVGGTESTDCLNALVPKNRSQDISITLRVGYQKGLDLVDKFQLKPISEQISQLHLSL